MRVGGDIEVHARQHDDRNLAEAQEATRGQTACRLERQERDRDELEKERTTRQRGRRSGMRNEVCFDESAGDDDERGLNQERETERDGPARTEEVHSPGEGERARHEGRYGNQRLEPAKWFGLGLTRSPEAERDRVPCDRGQLEELGFSRAGLPRLETAVPVCKPK